MAPLLRQLASRPPGIVPGHDQGQIHTAMIRRLAIKNPQDNVGDFRLRSYEDLRFSLRRSALRPRLQQRYHTCRVSLHIGGGHSQLAGHGGLLRRGEGALTWLAAMWSAVCPVSGADPDPAAAGTPTGGGTRASRAAASCSEPLLWVNCSSPHCNTCRHEHRLSSRRRRSGKEREAESEPEVGEFVLLTSDLSGSSRPYCAASCSGDSRSNGCPRAAADTASCSPKGG